MIKSSNSNPTKIDPLLNVTQVKCLTSLSRSSIERGVKVGRFPGPVRLPGGRRVAWRQSEVQAWIEDPLGWGDVITF